jgi:hypothetical protein
LPPTPAALMEIASTCPCISSRLLLFDRSSTLEEK